MTPGAVRLLFDECLPRPLVAMLVESLNLGGEDGPLVRHLFDIAPSGTFDEVWIPRLKDEGWTIISADGGRTPNRGRGKKLPRLCLESGFTLILLSPSVHQRKVADKLQTILSVWERIVEIAGDSAERGERFMIEPLNRDEIGVGRITRRRIRQRPHDPLG